jgi:hypothetical protein
LFEVVFESTGDFVIIQPQGLKSFPRIMSKPNEFHWEEGEI